MRPLSVTAIMQAANPVDEDAFEDAWSDPHGQAAFERIMADQTQESAGRTPRVRRRVSMRRRAWVSGAVAAAVATGAIAATSHGGSAQHSTAIAPIRTVGYLLDQAAKHTLAAGDPVIPPGQYRHVTTRGTSLWVTFKAFILPGGPLGRHPSPAQLRMLRTLTQQATIEYLSEGSHEVWVPADGKGTWYWRYTDRLSVSFFSAAEKRYFETHLPGMLRKGVSNFTGTDGQLGMGASRVPTSWDAPTPAWLAALPRDPDALLSRLLGDTTKYINSQSAFAANKHDKIDKYDEAFDNVVQALSSGLIPADLRAALYQVARRIPGVKLIDSAANFDGQRGVAVGRVDSTGATRQEIIFDAVNGKFIGGRGIQLKAGVYPDIPAGTLIGSSAVTDDITATHPG